MQFSAIVNGKPLLERIVEGDGYNGQPVTMTGRPWREGYRFNEDAEYCISDTVPNGNLALYKSDKKLYYIGQTRALQPGRGKPGVWWRKTEAFGVQTISYSQKYHDLVGIDELQMAEFGFRPARIRITSLEKQDVREMTDAQAQRTGFPSAVDYLAWWVNQYEAKAEYQTAIAIDGKYPKHVWDFQKVENRPASIYTALMVGFEFVGEE